MLIPRSEGGYTAGPLDIQCILHNLEAGTFHAAFFEERPPPGPVLPVAETALVRLWSKMHHVTGSPTLEGAQAHLDDLAAKIQVRPENIARTQAYPWDGTPAIVWCVENWRLEPGRTFADVSTEPG